MKFKYFRDPDNFSFKVDEPSECSLCGKVGLWFDGGGFSGVDDIECVCDSCLVDGRLQELEIETNEALEGCVEDQKIIIYKTPSLPTWQDRAWPFVNGSYCVFERMASKADFESKEDFMSSVLDSEGKNSDLKWLWEGLPEKRIANHKEGNFNVSVYLFTSNGEKYCIWDAC